MKFTRSTARREYPPNVGSLALAALSMGMRDEAPEPPKEPEQLELTEEIIDAAI